MEASARHDMLQALEEYKCRNQEAGSAAFCKKPGSKLIITHHVSGYLNAFAVSTRSANPTKVRHRDRHWPDRPMDWPTGLQGPELELLLELLAALQASQASASLGAAVGSIAPLRSRADHADHVTNIDQLSVNSSCMASLRIPLGIAGLHACRFSTKGTKWNEQLGVGQVLTATAVDVDCHHCSSSKCLCLLRIIRQVSILGPGWHLLSSALRPKIAGSPTLKTSTKS